MIHHALETRNRLRIRLPEGVSFAFRLGSPVSRALALAIDLMCVGLLTMLFTYLSHLIGVLSQDIAMALLFLLSFLALNVYFIGFEWLFRGRTLGKWLFRLQVMDVQGLPITFSQIFVRNIMRVIDTMPPLTVVGLISALVSRRSQRLGDLAANTVVVDASPTRYPDIAGVMPGKFNSFRDYPHLEARLRQHVRPEESAVVVQALLRKDEMDADARLLLYRDLADLLREKVNFPEDAIRGLADEQYLRNAVDSLYRGTGEARRALQRTRG